MASYNDIVGDGVKRTFSKNLQDRMRVYGINQTELARRMGVSQSTMSGWYNGQVLPRNSRLEQLYEILNCEPSDLFGDVQTAVDVELQRRLDAMQSAPEVQKLADQLRPELVDAYQAISRAMSELDQPEIEKLAAYAEGLLAASGKEKTS